MTNTPFFKGTRFVVLRHVKAWFIWDRMMQRQVGGYFRSPDSAAKRIDQLMLKQWGEPR